MNPTRYGTMAATILVLMATAAAWAADAKVATAVYGRVGNGYKREKAKDGSFKPEYYALSNGGLISGTISDITIDRVTYPEVTEVAMPLLAQQNYRYAKYKEQAKLLLVLNWGSTLAPNGTHKEMNIANAKTAMETLSYNKDMARAAPLDPADVKPPSYAGEDIAGNTAAGFGPSVTSSRATNEVMAVHASAGAVESQFLQMMTDDRVRDQLNERNARVLGYLDDLAGSDGIRRWAGGGDRYNDLRQDVEESRYYIVISAYDFKELTEKNNKKLLWQTRVSVRSPGNSFDDSLAAMMKSASKYFGQNSGQLVRGEEAKGTVELGELKILGVAKEPEKPSTKKEK